MRTRFSLAVCAFAALLVASTVQAQQPLNPYGSTTTTTTTTTTTAAAPAPLDPYPYGYGYYPPPPSYGYQSPAAGPGYHTTVPSYQQGYYLYPTQSGTWPVYYAPGSYCGCQPASYGTLRAANYHVLTLTRPRKLEKVRRVSIGVHGTVLGIDQSIGNSNMVLGGAGIHLRIRTRGRFGLELRQDFLHASYWNGDFERTSYPFAFSLMFYVFPNQDTRHFNLYGLAGVGAMYDAVNVRDENRQKVEQDFIEWTAHVGLGAELRFKWFAIEADARLVGLLRDDLSTPASYYSGVSGGPVPSSSYGGQGDVYLSLWF